jgi:hypothetical protein
MAGSLDQGCDKAGKMRADGPHMAEVEMASVLRTSLPSGEERAAAGRALRERVRRGDLGRWRPAEGRPDPIDLIEEAHEGRLQRLIPVRVGRMMVSPYAFLRGSAALMAEDFAHLPRTGIEPVICGDAHLGNFGFYASPERDLVFDLNDFDEAHPGPWEWDLYRLATSVWVAGRQNGLSGTPARMRPCAAPTPTAGSSGSWPASRCCPGPSTASTSTGCGPSWPTGRCGARSSGRPGRPAPGPATGPCPS